MKLSKPIRTWTSHMEEKLNYLLNRFYEMGLLRYPSDHILCGIREGLHLALVGLGLLWAFVIPFVCDVTGRVQTSWMEPAGWIILGMICVKFYKDHYGDGNSHAD